MFCTNCGCENNDSSKFCKQCGTPLETLIAEEKVDVTEPEVTESEVTESEVAEPETTEAAQAAEPEVTTAETAETSTTSETAETSTATEAAAQPAAPQTPPAQTFTAQGQTTSMSGFGDMLRLGITSPFKGIKNANKPENWLGGMLIFLITDVIISLLITVAVSVVVGYVAGGYMNIAGLSLSMAGYSSGVVFLTAFLLLLFSDVLEVFIIFGMGKAFGSKATLKQWISVCATSQILFRLLAMIAILFMMIGSGGMVIAMIILSIGCLSYLILMFKAFEVSTGLANNKLFYGFICAYFVYLIAFSLVTGAVTAINAANAYNNTYEPYNNFFDNNSF